MFEDKIAQIARSIWHSLSQLPIERSSTPADVDAAAAVTATISFSGAWEGQVHATMSEELCRRLAAATLETSPHELGQDETQDVMKELINMLGGNIQALLPQPCRLSLPQVASRNEDVTQKSRTVEETVHLECDRESVKIRLSAGPSTPPAKP